jgi:hypothetical protein
LSRDHRCSKAASSSYVYIWSFDAGDPTVKLSCPTARIQSFIDGAKLSCPTARFCSHYPLTVNKICCILKSIWHSPKTLKNVFKKLVYKCNKSPTLKLKESPNFSFVE